MCTGVTEGFAGVKLSGSLKMYGSFRVNIVRVIIVIANPRMSPCCKVWVKQDFICIFV